MVGELAPNRVEAMRDFGPPLPNVVGLMNMTVHVDRVSTHYLDTLRNHVDDGVLTLTAAQATAILFVSCGLLESPMPELPVQYLVVPGT